MGQEPLVRTKSHGESGNHGGLGKAGTAGKHGQLPPINGSAPAIVPGVRKSMMGAIASRSQTLPPHEEQSPSLAMSMRRSATGIDLNSGSGDAFAARSLVNRSLSMCPSGALLPLKGILGGNE